jgi:hypothetical protein
VTGCLTGLVNLNTLQVSMVTDIARWLFLNVSTVTDEDLIPFVAAFIHFKFSDSNFMSAIERYVTARGVGWLLDHFELYLIQNCYTLLQVS